MNTTIASVLATLLLLLGIACQQSNDDVDQLVDERIAAALAAVVTITPQPTATPQPGSANKIEATFQSLNATIQSLEFTIESLAGRLAAAESELLAQDNEFRDLVDALTEPEPDVILNNSARLVTTAIESTTYLGGCWIHRRAAGGNGDTFLIEWDILGNIESLCFNPSSICVEEVMIGATLPQSCGTR